MAQNSFDTIAKESWNKEFSNHLYCKNSELQVSCVENEISVLCETAPIAKSGDMDCYSLVEIFAFIPAEKSETGELVVVGKSHPSW